MSRERTSRYPTFRPEEVGQHRRSTAAKLVRTGIVELERPPRQLQVWGSAAYTVPRVGPPKKATTRDEERIDHALATPPKLLRWIADSAVILGGGIEDGGFDRCQRQLVDGQCALARVSGQFRHPFGGTKISPACGTPDLFCWR